MFDGRKMVKFFLMKKLAIALSGFVWPRIG
jgi:hypothetical protein